MPDPAFLTLESTTESSMTEGASSQDSIGPFKREGENFVDKILVEGFSHEVNRPVDPQSGQATGSRIHGAFVITKLVDKTTPMLYLHLVNGTHFNSVKIEFYRTDDEGAPELYYSVELQDAVLTGMKTYIPNCLDPSNERLWHFDEVKFAYGNITWLHEKAGTSGSDSWSHGPGA